MIRDITDQLQRDEGFRSTTYIDTVGKRTIGYGHNLDARPIPDLIEPVSENQAAHILFQDIFMTRAKLSAALPWWGALDTVRQGVLTNMAFNMGVNGLLGFHRMLSYVALQDWGAAAQEMTQSKWYVQVGARAERLARQMLLGIWQ